MTNSSINTNDGSQNLTPAHFTSASSRILRLPQVIARVGLRRASIYQHMAQGSFPKPISLGLRARGWVESEIDAWIDVRVQARKSPKL